MGRPHAPAPPPRESFTHSLFSPSALARPLPGPPLRRTDVRVETHNTPLPSGSGRPDFFLHHITASPRLASAPDAAAAAAARPPLVLMPGYGAGAAFFFRSISPLASAGLRVFAVDWLGTGLSGRPRFTPGNYEESVRWFTDSLEEWRIANKLERFDLLGHSLGALGDCMHPLTPIPIHFDAHGTCRSLGHFIRNSAEKGCAGRKGAKSA